MQRELARILDANFNRAREGLRVAEEFARFVIEDRRLAEQAKTFRHELAESARRLDPAGVMLGARDTAGDLGTGLANESARGSAAEVATAAAKRVGEALRVLGEYAKVIDGAAAGRLDQLRYRFYDWEKWLSGAADRRRFARVRLYVLLTQQYCRGGDWQAAARAAIDGGADAIQLREKQLDGGELLDRAGWLAELCRAAGVLSIVNDRPDIARLADADGVHVGLTDLPVRAAREIVKVNQFVGASTHTPADLDRVLDGGPSNVAQPPSAVRVVGAGLVPARGRPQGSPLPSSAEGRISAASQPTDSRGRLSHMNDAPDYVALGPMFPTNTKPDYRVAGAAYAQSAIGRLDALGLPHVAVGGITLANLAELLPAGVRCVAVCSAILAVDDVAAAARAFKRGLT